MSESAPDFLCIGMPRCGTSWLWKNFRQNSTIFAPLIKELHYFSRSEAYSSPNKLSTTRLWDRLKGEREGDLKRLFIGSLRTINSIVPFTKNTSANRFRWLLRYYFYDYTDDWYRSLFEKSFSRGRVSGELTPAYSKLKIEDIYRIYEINSDMKIIIMLRDPIQRVWSSIRYNIGRGRLNIDPSDGGQLIDYLSKKEDWDVNRYRYGYVIDKYLEVFNSNNIIVGFQEAILEQPNTLLKNIYEHIGAGIEKTKLSSKKVNKSKISYDMPKQVEDYLSQFIILR